VSSLKERSKRRVHKSSRSKKYSASMLARLSELYGALQVLNERATSIPWAVQDLEDAMDIMYLQSMAEAEFYRE
jgi:hypothetical protein